MNNDIEGFYCDFIGWTLAHTGLFHKRRLPDIHVRIWISNDIHCLMWEMILILAMMTSSNENIFRVTCPLWGEYTGHRWVPSRRPVKRSFGVFFDLRLNTHMSKQSRRRWFATPSQSIWRNCNEPCRKHCAGLINALFEPNRAIFDRKYGQKGEIIFMILADLNTTYQPLSLGKSQPPYMSYVVNSKHQLP